MRFESLINLSDIIMGQSPKKETVNIEGKGYPLLNGPTEFSYFHPTPVQYTTDPKKIAPKGSLLFCVRGSTVGRMNWADQDYAIGRGLAAIIAHNEKEKYYFKNIIYLRLGHLLSKATGSTFPNISKSDLHSFQVPIISKMEILNNLTKAIEEKIYLNNQMATTLEDLAIAFFRHWFVDFEFPDENGNPYKSSGGKMVESELGETPQCFSLGSFNHFFNEAIGGDWGKEKPTGNHAKEVVVIRGADINDVKRGGIGKAPTRFILEKNYKNKKLQSGDIIIEISGGSPTQSTGRTTYINEDIIQRHNDKLICTNFCRVLRPKEAHYSYFSYLHFNYLWQIL